jgi:hypothetical protein
MLDREGNRERITVSRLLLHAYFDKIVFGRHVLQCCLLFLHDGRYCKSKVVFRKCHLELMQCALFRVFALQPQTAVVREG